MAALFEAAEFGTPPVNWIGFRVALAALGGWCRSSVTC